MCAHIKYTYAQARNDCDNPHNISSVCKTASRCNCSSVNIIMTFDFGGLQWSARYACVWLSHGWRPFDVYLSTCLPHGAINYNTHYHYISVNNAHCVCVLAAQTIPPLRITVYPKPLIWWIYAVAQQQTCALTYARTNERACRLARYIVERAVATSPARARLRLTTSRGVSKFNRNMLASCVAMYFRANAPFCINT